MPPFWILLNLDKPRFSATQKSRAGLHFLQCCDILFTRAARHRSWLFNQLKETETHYSYFGILTLVGCQLHDRLQNLIDNFLCLSRLRCQLRFRPFDHLWALWAIVQCQSLGQSSTEPLPLVSVLLQTTSDRFVFHCSKLQWLHANASIAQYFRNSFAVQ